MIFSSKYNIDEFMPFTAYHALSLSANRVFGRIITISGLLAALHAISIFANDYFENQ